MHPSKAFDTLDHNVLFCKLAHYGIQGLDVNWFKSYRTQCVKNKNCNSERNIIKCGVPQDQFYFLYIS